MKKRAFIMVFFLLMPAVFAGIDVRQDESNYNIGDKISVSASVIEDVGVDGFFKAKIECTGYAMQYFVTPLSLEKDFRTSVNVPDLTATKDMLGSCKVQAIIEAAEGAVDSGYTDDFEVENTLGISCDGDDAVPGEEAEINCIVKKVSGEMISDGTAMLSYGKKEYTKNIEEGISDFLIPIASDTPSGMQKMGVEAEDTKGNYGNFILKFNVKAIPTRLENRVNKDSFNIGETLEIKPVVYDHVDGFMDSTIKLELTDPEGKKLISNDVLSGGTISYTFNSYSVPGDYKIKGSSEGLVNENIVRLERLSKLKMTYSAEKVTVENIGNTVYDDMTTIVLEDEEGKKYMIEKKLNLEPGEAKGIDLSKEVPYGHYDVVLPVASTEEEPAGSQEESKVVENVEIHDNRPAYKKIGSGFGEGFGMVTGIAVGTVGYVAAKPLAASIILVVIILVIVLFYSKDVIRSRMRKVRIKVDKKEGIHTEKKDDEIEGLFKDFKYEK